MRPEAVFFRNGLNRDKWGEAVGGTPDTTSGDGAAGRGWWARSWIGRHWRGELPLAKAFWLNGFLFNMALGVLGAEMAFLTVGSGDDIPEGWQRVIAAITGLMGVPISFVWLLLRHMPDPGKVIMVAMISAVAVWQIVGIWRSAGRYPGWWPEEGRDLNDSSRRVFMVAARVVVVVWVLLRLNLVQCTMQ